MDLAGRSCCPLLDGMSQEHKISNVQLPECFHPFQGADGQDGGNDEHDDGGGGGEGEKEKKEETMTGGMERLPWI